MGSRGLDIFCLVCKQVFDGYENYNTHLEPVEESVEDDE